MQPATCHQDTWLVGRVATVIAIVDTRRIAAFFIVSPIVVLLS
jgi:hypothetical protein